MRYCEECGSELKDRYLENEGIIPYCSKCGAYRFPKYNVAVSIITVDDACDKILLIQQYGKKSYILVAGYVNEGECAEHAVVRELKEETGLTAAKVCYNRSSFFAPSNTLMLNFTAHITDASALRLNSEVDKATWFSFDEAKKNIRPDSLAQRFLNAYLDPPESMTETG